MSSAAPRPLVVSLSIAVLCLVWGSTWWAIRVGLRDLPPCTAAAARFLLAGLVMIPVARLLGDRETGDVPPAWLWGSLGLTCFALSYGVLYATETVVPSGIAAVLWAVFPALMAIAGHCFLGERLTVRHATGFAVAFAGVVALYAGNLGGERGSVLPAACLLLSSPVVSAVGTTIVKRWGGGHSSLLLNRNAMLLGGLLLAVAAFALERDAERRWTAAAIGSIVYLALVGTSLTFGLYFWLLRWSQASRLGLISYVTPCLAVLLGWLAGDGALDLPTLLGTAAIVGGVTLVVRRPRPAAGAAG